MSNYCYEAVDSGGLKMQGSLDVADQGEALRRIKEMGLFPTRLAEVGRRCHKTTSRPQSFLGRKDSLLRVPIFDRRIKPKTLAVLTRQLATLVDAGMPLLRGLRTLQEQEENRTLKRMLGEVAASIEGGGSLSEALSAFPKVFNQLYMNMVKAGELGGVLELTLRRLAEFMEKSQKIKGKVKAALFYPAAVFFVATLVLGVMMVYVVPRFQEVFEGLLGGAAMPPFTVFVLNLSAVLKDHLFVAAITFGLCLGSFLLAVRTGRGRRWFDRFRLTVPILGPVVRKVAISRFARTLGTLLNSGVPILQALAIVKETAGNVVVGNVISLVHDSVKEGGTVAGPLKASGVFPAMVAGMVDVGEQTGALPDMLMKIGDIYDDEVDNAVSALTSLLEPVMILFLAVVVGSIVIAMFLPLIVIMNHGIDPGANQGGL
jgi:type IV pilus assembly protein PilC